MVAQAPGGIRHRVTAVVAGYGLTLSTVGTASLVRRLTAGGEKVKQAPKAVVTENNIVWERELRDKTTP